MRFPVLLLAGLGCIVLGIGISEYSRRHPAEKPSQIAEAAKAAATKVTPEELISTESLSDLSPDADAVKLANLELLAQSTNLELPEDVTVHGAKAVLGGTLFARNALGHANTLFLIVEEGKQGAKQTLVRLTANDAPKALAVHRPGITALAAEGSKVYWAEGGNLYAIDAQQGGTAKGVVRFTKARVTSLGVHGQVLVATLVPDALDPFSSDPVGGVVSIAVDNGKVQALATQQIRPSEAGCDGTNAVWVAGYPADLFSANLVTHSQTTLASRVDGPALVHDGAVVFRHPASGDPGLQRVGITGGEPATVAKGDIDRVCGFGNDLWFSVGGAISHVTAEGNGEKEVAKLAHPVSELAATDDALYALVRQNSGGHLLLALPRSPTEGSR
jgi:hypothetical protein